MRSAGNILLRIHLQGERQVLKLLFKLMSLIWVSPLAKVEQLAWIMSMPREDSNQRQDQAAREVYQRVLCPQLVVRQLLDRINTLGPILSCQFVSH